MQALIIDAEWAPRPDYPLSPAEEQAHRAIIGSDVWRNPTLQVGLAEEPNISGPDEVLIRTRAVGICGSDLHMTETDGDGYLRLNYRMKLPVAVGHEFSGEVVEVGSEVHKVGVGDPVAVEAQTYCGHCEACARNLPNLCIHGEDLGFTLPGGTSQYVVARERQVWPLTSILPRFSESKVFDVGAVIEPTSVAYNGMFSIAGGFRPGGNAAVFGCGPVGLAAVGLARAAGAGRVIAIDPVAARRAMAEEIGADVTIDPATTGSPGQAILDSTGGQGADIVIEAAGAASITMDAIEQSLAYGAKVVLIGMNLRPVPVQSVRFQMRGARLYGSLGHLGGGFPSAIALHAAGKIDMSQMITSRFALLSGVDAFERLKAREDAKILIYPN